MAAARAGHLSRLSRARVLVHSLRRSEEHTSELSHQIISYAVFCLKKKKRVKWVDVDLLGRAFTLRAPKNHEDHTLPITDQALELFAALPRVSAYVLPGSSKAGSLSS